MIQQRNCRENFKNERSTDEQWEVEKFAYKHFVKELKSKIKENSYAEITFTIKEKKVGYDENDDEKAYNYVKNNFKSER